MAKKKILSIGGLADFWALLKEKFEKLTSDLSDLSTKTGTNTTDISKLKADVKAIDNFTDPAQYNTSGDTIWNRVVKLTHTYASGIFFFCTGAWAGDAELVTIGINHSYNAKDKNTKVLRVIAGDSVCLYAARLVKEGDSTYLELRSWNRKAVGKAVGFGLEIVPGMPVVPDTPAEGAEVTDLEIIRESAVITNAEIDAIAAAPSAAAAVALADTADAEPEQTAPEQGAVIDETETNQAEDSLSNSSL